MKKLIIALCLLALAVPAMADYQVCDNAAKVAVLASYATCKSVSPSRSKTENATLKMVLEDDIAQGWADEEVKALAGKIFGAIQREPTICNMGGKEIYDVFFVACME